MFRDYFSRRLAVFCAPNQEFRLLPQAMFEAYIKTYTMQIERQYTNGFVCHVSCFDPIFPSD